MKRLLLCIMLLGCGHSPSWENVIRHPDGTYEDKESGECWIDTGYRYIPAQCPKENPS